MSLESTLSLKPMKPALQSRLAHLFFDDPGYMRTRYDYWRLIGECFGLVSFGTVSGSVGLFVSSGAAIGPTIAGVIYDATHSYRKAFIIFAVVSLMAMLAILFAKPPRKFPIPKTEKSYDLRL